MTKQNLEFIATTINAMLTGVEPEQIKVIIGSANQYASVLKFDKDKTYWTDEQLNRYFN